MDDQTVFEFALHSARAEGFNEDQAKIFAAGCRLFFKLGRRVERQNRKRQKGSTRKSVGRPTLTGDRLTRDSLPEFMVECVRELKQTHPDLKTDTDRIAYFLRRLDLTKSLTRKQAKGIHDRQLARERRIAKGRPTKADRQYIARKSLILGAYKSFNSGGP